MSTIRSLRTDRPRIGSTVAFGATSCTSTLQASAFRPLISIASEPQMPWAQRAAEGERAVVAPLHLVERVEQPVGRLHLHRELVPPRLVGDLRVVSPDLEGQRHPAVV